MTDLLMVALAKALEKDAKGIRLAPGDYDVNEDITLHVEGTVRKGKDSPYTPTVDIPLIPTLALLLERMGATREAAKAALVSAMQEALHYGEKGEGPVAERIRDIEAAIAHVRQVTGLLPQKIRTGATVVDVDVTEEEIVQFV